MMLRAAFLILLAAAPLGCGGASIETTPEQRSAALPGTPAAAAAEAPPAEPNQVVIDNFRYRPRTLTVPAGTRVTWVNHDDVPHTATSTARPRTFDSKTLDTDDQFAHVFATPGTYEYFCAVHPHMTGTVIVK